MRRVKDDERLTRRFMVNCTEDQHRIVMDEAEQDDIQPGIVARRAFTMGLQELRKKRQGVRRQLEYLDRKAKGDKRQAAKGETA